jgi:hypothetical protein
VEPRRERSRVRSVGSPNAGKLVADEPVHLLDDATGDAAFFS